MNCKQCGALNNESSNFCGGCGTNLVAELLCVECAKPLKLGVSFCDRCGTKVNFSDSAYSPNSSADITPNHYMRSADRFPIDSIALKALPANEKLSQEKVAGYAKKIFKVFVFYPALLILVAIFLGSLFELIFKHSSDNSQLEAPAAEAPAVEAPTSQSALVDINSSEVNQNALPPDFSGEPTDALKKSFDDHYKMLQESDALSTSIKNQLTNLKPKLNIGERSDKISVAEDLEVLAVKLRNSSQQTKIQSITLTQLASELESRSIDLPLSSADLHYLTSELTTMVANIDQNIAGMRTELNNMRNADSDLSSTRSRYSESNRFSLEQQLIQSQTYAKTTQQEIDKLPPEATQHRRLLEQELHEHEMTIKFSSDQLK
jgi:hypothetical protein